MLRSGDVAQWLRDQGIAADPNTKVTTEDPLPAMPDRVCAIALFGGGPTKLERVLDVSQAQVLCRGTQGNPQNAEAFAEQIDDVLMAAVPPVLMGGRRIISIDRLGGPPARIDTDPGRRQIMAWSVMLQVARDVF